MRTSWESSPAFDEQWQMLQRAQNHVTETAEVEDSMNSHIIFYRFRLSDLWEDTTAILIIVSSRKFPGLHNIMPDAQDILLNDTQLYVH